MFVPQISKTVLFFYSKFVLENAFMFKATKKYPKDLGCAVAYDVAEMGIFVHCLVTKCLLRFIV